MQGLVTNPSRILAGESGLSHCENATCKSPGSVEPRGGQDFYFSTNASAETSMQYARQWHGEVWFAGTDGTNTHVYRGMDAASLFIGGLNPNVRAEPFADRQCWIFDSSLRMLDKSGETAPFTRTPGSPRAPGAFIKLTAAIAPVLTTTALPADYATAYRIVCVRHIETLAGPRVLYGAPSDRIVVRNTTAGTLDVLVKVYFAACDIKDAPSIGKLELQIYRCVSDVTPATADPGDDMRLVHTQVVVVADTITNSLTWYDTSIAASGLVQKGPPLYTNANLGGSVANGNYKIPLANDVAYYNGMAFYGGARKGYTKDLTCLAVNTRGSIYRSTLGKSLRSVQFSGTLNATLNGFTAVTAAAYEYLCTLQKVAVVGTDPSGTGAGFRYIVSFNAAAQTIQLDSGWGMGAPGTVYTLIAWDWVGVTLQGGTIGVLPYTAQAIFAGPPVVTAGALWALGPYEAMGAPVFVTKHDDAGAVGETEHGMGGSDMERAWALKWNTTFAEWSVNTSKTMRLYTAAQPGAVEDQQINVQMRFQWDRSVVVSGTPDFDEHPFAVITNRTAAFSIPLASASYDAFSLSRGISEIEGGPNRLAWSKAYEPEAVPLLQYVDIGDSAAPIVRVIATNDRLWIFKTDGLWSAYGDSPGDLTFQQVDPTIRLLATTRTPTLTQSESVAPWVTRLGNHVYAWTNAGIFRVSSAGVERVDGAIETDIRKWTPVGGIIQGGGLFSASSVYDDLVVFGMRTVEAYVPEQPGGGICYAYHVGSNTWSTWSTRFGLDFGFSLISGAAESDADSLLLASLGGYMLYNDRPRNDYAATANPAGIVPLTRSDRFLGTAAFVFAITAKTGLVATYTSSGGFPIPIGSVIYDGTQCHMVVDNDGFGLHMTLDHSNITLGVCTVYFPIPAVITYAATTQEAPSVYKRFRRAYFGFQQMRGGLWFTVSYRIRGEAASTIQTLTEYFPVPETIGSLPLAIGLLEDTEFDSSRDVPTEQAQGTGLEMTIRFSQAAAYFSIDAITVTYTPMSQTIGGRA